MTERPTSPEVPMSERHWPDLWQKVERLRDTIDRLAGEREPKRPTLTLIRGGRDAD